MARAILICGGICSGKSTYARKLCAERRAVSMSMDELMLAILGQYLGDMHDEYARRAERYLLNKSAQLIERGVDVVLDWGFWTRKSRQGVRRFFESRGFECELHFISIGTAAWRARIQQRNAEVRTGRSIDYIVDENLVDKFLSKFEPPERSEADVWIDAD